MRPIGFVPPKPEGGDRRHAAAKSGLFCQNRAETDLSCRPHGAELEVLLHHFASTLLKLDLRQGQSSPASTKVQFMRMLDARAKGNPALRPRRRPSAPQWRRPMTMQSEHHGLAESVGLQMTMAAIAIVAVIAIAWAYVF